MAMRNFVGLILFVQVLAVNSLAAQPVAKKIRIGFAMDTLREERWMRDRDHFVKAAQERGAEVLIQAANGNDALQYSQAENLLTQGVDVLVVAPHNGVTAASIVEAAHKMGKKVISYDRLIRNADVDLYVAFDNVEIGKLQADYLLKKIPKGNYVLIGGAPTDPNAKLLREGQMQVLKPAIDRGDVKIVADQWTREWQPSEALKHAENALTRTDNNIQAVVASNDGTAGGVISALKQQGLAGKVGVSGQDADLPGCQRIAEGSQSMTVYKPGRLLTARAVDAAIAFAKGEAAPGINKTVDNGKKLVPAILLTPIAIDQVNIDQTIVKDQYHPSIEIYKNVLKSKKES